MTTCLRRLLRCALSGWLVMLLAACSAGTKPLGSQATPVATSAARVVGQPFAVPLTWAALHLTGKLVFTAGTAGIGQLDLSSGQATVLFRPADPQNAYVTGQTVSPDGKSLVLAYAPPPEGSAMQLGYTGLFVMPMDGSKPPEPLLEHIAQKETYSNPTWSPDGQYLYYVHYGLDSGAGQVLNQIERINSATRQASAIAKNALWPRLSPDGAQLAYVVVDPNGSNALYVAAPDGHQARQIVLPSSFQFVDAPMFSPDNQTLLFSGATPNATPSASSFNRFWTVPVAYADGGPANWWRVPVQGGQPVQLTHIQDTGLYGSFSPDGQHVAYLSGSGLFVMSSDGQGLVAAVTPAIFPGAIWFGTVEWLR
jgi:Tol biopolymer transport system component